LAAGYPSAEQYLESIDSDEWTELLAFNALDPIGEQRADLRHAYMMALTRACHGDRSAKPNDDLLFPIHDSPTDRNEVLTERLDELFGVGNGKRS
jgi:hypothetical protein